MLSGLLGTVSGLITSFGAVSGESVDPSQKARILAEGISEAMNCTAFGLIVAIIGLVGFAVLNGKTQTLEDDINEASVQVLNLVVTNRQKVNMSGRRGRLTFGTVGTQAETSDSSLSSGRRGALVSPTTRDPGVMQWVA